MMIKILFIVNYFFMTKKDYIFNMVNLIKNRVNYHAPIRYHGDVDFDKLIEKGVDLSLPIFIMEKPLKKVLIKSFIKAQKEVKFNLILREKNRKLMKKIKKCFVIKEEEIPSLDMLNINYKTCSHYHKLESGNYLKVGKKIEDYEEKLFYLQKKDLYEGVYFTVKKFVLNGENIQIDLVNTNKTDKVIDIEYNRELQKGYYSFEKIRNGVKITNLFDNKEHYFNANFGRVNESYSCVDGIENSTYARINFKASIMLKPMQKRNLFINFGNKQFTLSNLSEMEYYFEIAQKKNYEIFDIKIESEDKFFERKFNKILPCKIWKAWLDGGRDLDSENRYLELKNNILLKQGKKNILPVNNYKIKEILSYNGKGYKKIAISP